ncbi:MAG: damage-inducible protein [Rhodospirillaceae bacterium]|nr:damage-inducible protein [Rhodospirillaceae bacterium]|tara:strand:+ start:106 stop:597 length:492 start_codon:yes stop_codon:yes gene_type:complete
MTDIQTLGAKAGALLKERGETIVVAESSAGGLISASLLSVPGASAYFLGGGVVYTSEARQALVGISQDEMDERGLRGAMEPYAELLAERLKNSHGAVWGLSETGASGPSGNRYGDPAGHTVLAISGPYCKTRTFQTGSRYRVANMWAFAVAAFSLLGEALESA